VTWYGMMRTPVQFETRFSNHWKEHYHPLWLLSNWFPSDGNPKVPPPPWKSILTCIFKDTLRFNSVYSKRTYGVQPSFCPTWSHNGHSKWVKINYLQSLQRIVQSSIEIKKGGRDLQLIFIHLKNDLSLWLQIPPCFAKVLKSDKTNSHPLLCRVQVDRFWMYIL